jgi:hypothetical protein
MQSEGPDLSFCVVYEQTFSSEKLVPTSARTMLRLATLSCGKAAPAGNGSVFWVLVEQVLEKVPTGPIGFVQPRSGQLGQAPGRQ